MRPATTIAVAVLLLCLLGAAVTQFFFLARDNAAENGQNVTVTTWGAAPGPALI